MSEYLSFDFDPNRVPADIAEAIGRLSAAWSQTESCVEDAIAGLARIDSLTGWAITTHMSLPARLDTLLALARLRLPGDGIEEIKKHIARIRACAEKRNLYIHGYWATHDVTNEIFVTRLKARGELKQEAIPAGATRSSTLPMRQTPAA